MQALPSSLVPAAAGSNRAASDRRRRWRDAAANMLAPAAVLVATWILFQSAIGLSFGTPGWVIITANSIGPPLTISILVALTAMIATFAPAMRAARVDPLETFRCE